MMAKFNGWLAFNQSKMWFVCKAQDFCRVHCIWH